MNTSNFIKVNSGIKVIDTQIKKEKYIFFKRGYDILTLNEDLLVRCLDYNILEKYKIKNNSVGYNLAKVLKKIKNIKIVKVIKRKKKKLREKGWKI